MIDFETPEEQKLHELLVGQADRAEIPADLRERVGVGAPHRSRSVLAGRSLLVAACLAIIGGLGAWILTTNLGENAPAGFDPGLYPEAGGSRFCGVDPPRTVVQVLAWMENDALPEDIAVVDSYLADTELVHSFRYVNSQETYAEFESFWTEQPEVLETVSPGDLPTSFRVRVSSETDTELLVPVLERLPGVLKVETADHTC